MGNSRGMTALHVAAAQSNNAKLVEFLLAHPRLDVNCKDGPLGTSVLHMAAAKNHVEVAKLILAEPRFTLANDLCSLEERSALSIAAIKANWEVLNVLVTHPSIDLGVKHKNGATLEEILRDCPDPAQKKKIKKTLKEAMKVRLARQCGLPPRQGSAAAQAGANVVSGNVNDKADSICWFRHADVTKLENNKCAGCRKARYCDERCQKADWGRHGDYCVKMQEKIRKKIEAKKAEQENK